MTSMIPDAVMGKEDTIAAIERLKAQLESGEISCAALRLFLKDGTWQDVAIGGDEEEKAEALEHLRQVYAQSN